MWGRGGNVPEFYTQLPAILRSQMKISQYGFLQRRICRECAEDVLWFAKAWVHRRREAIESVILGDNTIGLIKRLSAWSCRSPQLTTDIIIFTDTGGNRVKSPNVFWNPNYENNASLYESSSDISNWYQHHTESLRVKLQSVRKKINSTKGP